VRFCGTPKALARFAGLWYRFSLSGVRPSSRQLHAVVCHQAVQLTHLRIEQRVRSQMSTCLTNGPLWMDASLGLLAGRDTQRVRSAKLHSTICVVHAKAASSDDAPARLVRKSPEPLGRSARPIVNREKLAKKVERLAVEALRMQEQSWKKLSELRPLISQLREQFMKLKPGEKIAGCPTWTAYCKRVLHRTDRRIRQILEGANPASEKHRPKSLPGPKTVKVEWTREMVVANSFWFAHAEFQLAKLPEEEQ
jgi:hypothetical protein